MADLLIPIAPVTPFDIWTYVTRVLTNPASAQDLANMLVGISPTATGRAALIDRLDALISSRVAFTSYRYYAAMAAGATYLPPANTLATGLGLGGGTSPHAEFYDGAAWNDSTAGADETLFIDSGQNVRIHNGGGAAIKMQLTGVTWS